MAADEGRYTFIDRNISANLRIYREAGTISQDELAQLMADRGFGFSQATIWKIESAAPRKGERAGRAGRFAGGHDRLEPYPQAGRGPAPGPAGPSQPQCPTMLTRP